MQSTKKSLRRQAAATRSAPRGNGNGKTGHVRIRERDLQKIRPSPEDLKPCGPLDPGVQALALLEYRQEQSAATAPTSTISGEKKLAQISEAKLPMPDAVIRKELGGDQ